MGLLHNHQRVLLRAACAAAVLCVLAIFAVDGPLAIALSSLSSVGKNAIDRAVGVCEVLFAFGISPYLVVVPVLISAARVAVNDHYLSDVLGSAAVAAILTWVYAVAVLGRSRLKLNRS